MAPLSLPLCFSVYQRIVIGFWYLISGSCSSLLLSKALFLHSIQFEKKILWLLCFVQKGIASRIMAQQMYICDVTGNVDTWRVKVLVSEKSNVYTNEKETRLQKLLLIDAKGDRVEGVIWGSNIDVLQGTLKPFLTYIIGGAKVQAAKQGFKNATPGITTQWVLSRSTFIHLVKEEAEKIPYPAIRSLPFKDIRSRADTGEPIDILAVVIRVKEPRLVEASGKLIPIRECTVVTHELDPLMLTLWGDFTERQGAELFALRNELPIVLCRGLRATSFSGISLSTIIFSFVSLEPNIPEAAALRAWKEEHFAELSQIMTEPARNHLEMAVNRSEPIRFTKLADIIPDTPAAKSAVTMRIANINQVVTYTTCPNCNQTQKAISGEKFECNSCSEEHTAIPRCRVAVEISDDSKTISATLFDTSADRLLNSTPKEVHNMDSQTITEHLKQINTRLKDRKFIAQIRGTKKNFKDKLTRYTVQEWVEDTRNKDIPLAIEGASSSSITDTTTATSTASNVSVPGEDSSPTKKLKTETHEKKPTATQAGNK